MTTEAKKSPSLFPTTMRELLSPSRFFNTDLFDWGNDVFNSRLTLNVPSVNIAENDDNYQIEVAAPGLEKKDFKIDVDDHHITISAEKEIESKDKKKNYTRREYAYNSFSRSFRLPENSEPGKSSAVYENGVLKITMPKKEVTATKPGTQIEVR